ncbi:MAG: electron transfer flavoprotein subunit beta [Epulopiscium sp. Nuni2H_MBin003]|nr:MAG: electron transfer flavoprotein subunit beta [Epulopiscium sp. Nuni2H_MBin003]
MNIIVCVKQVPDTTEVKLDPVTNTLIRDGIPSIMNPDDKAALELALQLKDDNGAKVTVITMGPPQATKVLREALGMGADEALLMTDRAFAGADTWATSKTIASLIKTLPYDMIVCGRQAIDGDTAQVGPQICEHLGIPQVSYCEDVKIENGLVVAKRQFEDRHHIIHMKTPCAITALSECTEPRYMSVSKVIDAFDKEIKTITFADLDLKPEEIGLKGSPTRVKKSMTKGMIAKEPPMDVPPAEAATVIAEYLHKNHII